MFSDRSFILHLTIKHILLDCIDFQPIRDKHYSAENMYNLFDTVRIDSIIAFIKEIGLYNKLWYFLIPPFKFIFLPIIAFYLHFASLYWED